MRKGWSIVMLALLCGGLTGCNQMGVKQNADSAFEQVRDRFSEQQAFAFHGTTKLVTGDTANGNVVSFSGRKTGDDMLMRVDFAVPEQKQAKSVSLLSKNEQIYVRTEGSAGWKNTSGQDAVFRQEMNNWDPVFAMEQINQMKKSVLPLQDRAPEDDIEAVRILMDSTKLKSWLAEQMKSQASARTQSHAGGAAVLQTEAIHQPRLKYALTLSDGTWNRPRTGATIQATEPPVDEIIDQMELEAEYTIYYNKNTKLPTNMTMSIRSEYDMNDQRVREYTQVETYLQNYGQAIPVPDPTAAGATG
ncbi:hypothetical protein P4V39_13615 [Brevibacillus borstelensis]|uniref:hypothetical protein n=1 Tax=Brevibacillus borstelensis TaxID=45462 RepID=UPI002E251B13|nr:hypothetical protein [Brevibacillus borstelensis]